MLPNGPIFSDFGPESDFFEQKGPELVRITTQKSGLGGIKQRQLNNLLHLRDLDWSSCGTSCLSNAESIVQYLTFWLARLEG